jgi:hypothetical protein
MSIIEKTTASIPIRANGDASEAIRIGHGWHALEWAGSEPFRWSEPDFEIHLDALGDCLVIDCARAESIGSADCLISDPLGWVEAPARRSRLVFGLKDLIAAPGTLRFSLFKTSTLRTNIRENELESPVCIGASRLYVAYGSANG